MSKAQQPDVQRGEPSHGKGTRHIRWAPLVDMAEAEPGEWFSIANPLATQDNAYTAVYTEYAKRHLEVRTKGDRVYVRVKP